MVGAIVVERALGGVGPIDDRGDFCILEREAPGLDRPSIVVITGLSKPNNSAFTDADYAGVCRLGEEYRRRTPRSVA